jgi:ornithine cyclodeaminase/alanine dehydrogenase-like protein (mu-crystallin family)
MHDKNAALILTRSDIIGLASIHDYFAAVADAFRAQAAGAVHAPPPMEIEGSDGAFHAKGASMKIGKQRLAALKLNGNFPFNPKRSGLPTIQGAIFLCNAENGALLAILDSVEITLRRTAAASAVAMDALALKSAETLLICGCGVQGRAHVEAFAPLRKFRRVIVFDKEETKARRLASDLARPLKLTIEIAGDLGDAARQSDVIVTSTPSTSPILTDTDIGPGAFIAAVGADNPHKNELAPELMRHAAIIADVADQCAVMGDLRAAIAAGALDRSAIRAELGEILAGSKAGRKRDDEIVIFDSTGAAFQDLAAAAMIVERAASTGARARINLGA